MTDARWDTIYKNPLDIPLPRVPTRYTPVVRDPTCPAHCSGRHQIEALVGCGLCGVAFYQIVTHEWPDSEGHYWHSRDALAGVPTDLLNCPRCRRPLQRMRP